MKGKKREIKKGDEVKKEIKSLKEEIYSLKLNLNSINEVLSKVKFPVAFPINERTDIQQTQKIVNPTDKYAINLEEKKANNILDNEHQNNGFLEPANRKTDNPTHIQQTIQHISMGNEGVPTDSSTDTRQTDTSYNSTTLTDLKGLDSAVSELKEDLLNKFRNLSQQEFKVFSSIYTLEETEEIVDYAVISSKLRLTESSIRDYVMKLEKKGIPIIKEKLKNRRISLHIRKELRDIFALDKLLKIRESSSLRNLRPLFMKEFKEFKEEAIVIEPERRLEQEILQEKEIQKKEKEQNIEELNEPFFY